MTGGAKQKPLDKAGRLQQPTSPFARKGCMALRLVAYDSKLEVVLLSHLHPGSELVHDCNAGYPKQMFSMAAACLALA